MADRRSTSTLRRNATSSVSDSGTGCFGLPIDVVSKQFQYQSWTR